MQLAYLLFLFLVLVADKLLNKLAGFIPEIVVARIHLHLVVVNVHNMRAHGVQKVAVVAYHQNGAVVINEEFFQPFDAVDVQAVGGLVQQDDAGRAEQRLCQQNLYLLALGKCVHLHGVLLHGDAQAVQKLVCLAFGLPAVQLGEFALQFGRALSVRLGKIRLGIQRIFFFHNGIQLRVAAQHHIHHTVIFIAEMVLLQHAHAVVRPKGNAARGGLQLAGQNAQEGRFPRAVRADDAIAVARGKFQIHMLIQRPCGKLQAYVGNGQHVLLPFQMPRARAHGAVFQLVLEYHARRRIANTFGACTALAHMI